MAKKKEAVKKNGKKEVKSITLGSVLSWVLSVLFVFLGLVLPLTGLKMAGFIMLVLAAVILPPLNRVYENKLHFKLSKALKAVIIILGIILFIVAVQPDPVCGDYECNGEETCKSCSEDCGRCAEDIAAEKQEAEEQQEQIIEDMQDSTVYVKYEMTGKNADGSYIDTFGTGSGVITSVSGSTLIIYTNRHVIDCGFTGKCYQKLTEKITIRTQDGGLYKVGAVSVARHKLDIAKLSVYVPNAQRYTAAKVGDAEVGDAVVAVGYPSYRVPGNVLEFSVAKGTVDAKKNLMMDDGFAFTSFESDAYTYSGSSGGGLFNEDGYLIGFTTWGSKGTDNRAIRAKDIVGSYLFTFCPKGMTWDNTGICRKPCKKSQIVNQYGSCVDRCTTFYCNGMLPYNYKTESCGNRNRYTLGSDGLCHKTCGQRNRYCSAGAYCWSNKCTGCKFGSKLYKNGYCAKWESHYAYG